MSSPNISVVIPLYNKVRFIDRAIQSVLSQAYSDFEVLVVDDGSTDEGVSRLEMFKSDSRLRIIRQSNFGVGAARNRGVAEAHGQIIAFLDADDEWLPNHLADLATLAERFPMAGLLASRFAFCDGDRVCPECSVQTPKPILIRDYFDRAARSTFVHTSACAVRSCVVTRIGGFVEGLNNGEDIEYWARLSLVYPIGYHPALSSLYHLNIPGSAMTARAEYKPHPIVIDTLRTYLNSESARREVAGSVHLYGANILMSLAVAAIASGRSEDALQLLKDDFLQGCTSPRLWKIRLAAALGCGRWLCSMSRKLRQIAPRATNAVELEKLRRSTCVAPCKPKI